MPFCKRRTGGLFVAVALALGGSAAPASADISGGPVINGTGQADSLYGTNGAETIYGQGGTDRLFGRGGADNLFGGDGIDMIFPGPGADRAYGGSGLYDMIFDDDQSIDWLSGGAERDEILAADGWTSHIDCGSGDDYAIADPGDNVYDCERVFRKSGPAQLLAGGLTHHLVLDNNAAHAIDLRNAPFHGSANGAWYVFAAVGDDIVAGGSRSMWVFPGGGSDRVEGSSAADTVIDDDGEKDSLHTGWGDDAIWSADGAADYIECQGGFDRVVADKVDITAPGCEIVHTA